MPLAFLNLGPSELAVLLLLFLLLFGVDKVPQMARSLGRARAELTRAEADVREALETEEERLMREQLAFERAREATVAREGPPAREALVRAALQLDIDPSDMSDDALRRAIAEASAGPERSAKNAADAQQ